MTRRMVSYSRNIQVLALVSILSVLAVSCNKRLEGCSPDSLPPPRSAFTIQEGPTTQIAAEVAKDVGKVVASGEGSVNRTIFIFEERHDSRLAQMEIAVMLWRLQKNQSLRQVSLEGAFAAKGPLPVKWFHDSTGSGEAKWAGQEAAFRLLRHGEISAAEFIALAQPAVQVKGNELEVEYNVEASKTTSTLGYLIGIAEKSLTSNETARADDLARVGKNDEALDIIFSKDPWSKDRYQKLYGNNVASIEESICVVREIEAKAKELGLEIDPQQEAGLRDDLNFYQTASKRSTTMVNNTLAMIDPASTAPVAIIIGAAHTARVVQLIKAAKLSYVVLSPLSLVTPTKASKLTVPMYKRKMALKSVDAAGMLGAFLDGRKKPPSVLDQRWFHIKSWIPPLTELIVNAAARNDAIPSDALKAQLQLSPLIKIDWSSIRITGKGDQVRVMFKMSVQPSDTDPQRTVEIWEVGWRERPPGDEPATIDVDTTTNDIDIEKLILATLAKDRNESPLSPTEDPGPKPGEVAIVQLSTKTRGAFATDPTLLQQITSAR